MVVIVMAVLVGCATPNASVGTSAGSVSPGTEPSATPWSSDATGAGSPSPSLAAGLFRNPVIDADFPDPFILADAGRYFAYATTDVSQNLQLARSSDLVTWEMLDDPLPKLPGWSSGDTWAPEVLKTSAGYVLYYTAHDSDLKRPDSNGSQCITLAVSKVPEGPFVDGSDKPLVCQADLGGSIDATAFVDVDKTPWLIWKNDGNCCNLPTRFFMQQLSPDGLSLTGKVTDLGVVNDASWEGSLIEAPTLTVKDGTYYLFYSANNYASSRYAVGYATAKDVTGPYHDAKENPILTSKGDAAGPGHQTIVTTDDGELWIAYHAWDPAQIGDNLGGRRAMWIDRLTFEGGKPVVHGPDEDP
ncbi:MAG: glycoside hydrolase family 43 protein, partial [Chloroflexota bacterium]